jgi:hypothetical protein
MTREGAGVSSCGVAGRLTLPSLIAVRETIEWRSGTSLVCKATTRQVRVSFANIMETA